MTDWSPGRVVADAFGFSATAFVAGVVTKALGQALEVTPGVPFLLAYGIFFVILPISGFFSDVDELVLRGVFFTVVVGFFSAYVFQDLGEVFAAFAGLLVGILIAVARNAW